MKKKYVNPITDIIDSDLSNVVCTSKTYSLTGGAEWGGEGEYAPGEWIDEGYGGGNTGGYNTEGIEETDEDIPSRAKAWGDLWDWD